MSPATHLARFLAFQTPCSISQSWTARFLYFFQEESSSCPVTQRCCTRRCGLPNCWSIRAKRAPLPAGGMATGFATHALRSLVRCQLAQTATTEANLTLSRSAAASSSLRKISRPCKSTSSARDHADARLQSVASEINCGAWMIISGDDSGPILTMRGTYHGWRMWCSR